MHLILRIVFCFFLFVFGCELKNPLISESQNEMVMIEGMTIEALFPKGKLTITTDAAMKRTFQWNNEKVTTTLLGRMKRWNGSFGAYFPGGGDPIHIVVEEGQQHFCSTMEALEWIDLQNSRISYIYTSDGLVVGWDVQSGNKVSKTIIQAQIWQLYVNGEKPNNIKNSNDKLINVYVNNNYKKSFPKIGTYKASVPKTINGYLVSGKAIDLMKEKKKSFDDIEKVLKYGELRRDGDYLTYYATGNKFDSFKDLFWVKIDKNKRIALFN